MCDSIHGGWLPGCGGLGRRSRNCECYTSLAVYAARVNTKTLYKAPSRCELLSGRVLYISFEETGPDYIIRSTLRH